MRRSILRSDICRDQITLAPQPILNWKIPPAWVWIMVSGVLAHSVVPVTDYIVWDGWWYRADLVRPNQLAVLAEIIHEIGRPLDMAFYAPLRWLGGDPVVWAKWLGTAAWIGSAVCMQAVLRRIGGLPDAVATAVSALVATLPVFDLLGELALWMNTACVLFFWLAWLLVSHLPELMGWRRITTRVAALGLFFVSFNLNSNLVMYYAVAVVLAGLRLPDLQPGTVLARLPRPAVRHADFLALPIIFWLWKTCFTPTSGFYATGYNQPSMAIDRLSTGYIGLVLNFVIRGLTELFASSTVVFAALVTAGMTAAVLKRTAATRQQIALPEKLDLRLLGWGVFLLCSAAFPYIVVGQQLASEGWLTRNCILCPLPVAMMACGLILTANRWLLPQVSSAWLAGVAALATLGMGSCMANYLAYQAFGAKQLSIRSGLSGAIGASDAIAVQLRDYTRIPGTILYYPPIIWTYIAHDADGLPKSFVIETATFAPDVFQPGADGQPQRLIPQIPLRAESLDQAITDTTMPYALEGVPRRGPQILATVEPGYPDANPADLGLRYLFLSWLNPGQLTEFVRGFTKIATHPLPPVE
jgi:hypothetical protein